MIWKQEFTLETINGLGKNTLAEHLGIEFTEIGPDFLKAKMPVDHRTVQPYGILHGGASLTLAETIGSVASTMCLADLTKNKVVGLEINANHLRPAPKGWVFAKVTPVRIGRTVHVWDIEIRDGQERKTCVSRLTMAVIGSG